MSIENGLLNLIEGPAIVGWEPDVVLIGLKDFAALDAAFLAFLAFLALSTSSAAEEELLDEVIMGAALTVPKFIEVSILPNFLLIIWYPVKP